jgi:hypothetical protein
LRRCLIGDGFRQLRQVTTRLRMPGLLGIALPRFMTTFNGGERLLLALTLAACQGLRGVCDVRVAIA